MSDADGQKRAAGEAAAGLVKSGMVVGLGNGFDRGLVRKSAGGARSRYHLHCDVAGDSGPAATSLGMKIGELGETRPIDLTVDGA